MEHDVTPGRRRQQSGAALLVVILLVATLSFIALGISERTTITAAQSTNFRARAEALWFALGAEQLAANGLSDVISESGGIVSIDAPWAREPFFVPIDNGSIRIFFADASGCFNVNWLGAGEADPGEKTLGEIEFERLAGFIGIEEDDAVRLSAIIRDWVDMDDQRSILGAEDAVYTLKPSPYRTAGGPMASITELRALDGLNRDLYLTIKPFLCALPGDGASVMNINMLTSIDAPLLAAALGDDISPEAAIELIDARPRGGYPTLEAFLSDEKVEGLGISPESRQRFSLSSNFMQARAEIVYNDAVIEMTVDLSVESDGLVHVLRRRLGAEE